MKYLLRPLLFMALISLTGCLDENSKDRLDEQQVYTTDKDVYVNAVATLYNYIGGDKDSEGLQGTYRGVYDYNTFTTDEAIIPIRGGDWYDGGFLAATLSAHLDASRRSIVQHLEISFISCGAF